MSQTRRQTITNALRERPLTLLEIARNFRTSAKSALADLEHIRRSIAGSERFVIDPAICGVCDFVFGDRARLETPSRCPRCKSEKIDDPSFAIEGR